MGIFEKNSDQSLGDSPEHSDGRARVVVLYGGVGPERDVSLSSGENVLRTLGESGLEHDGLCLDQEVLPQSLNPIRDVVFPVLHGEFGEDGGIQGLLEAEGFAYAGSDSLASLLCMDKPRAKARVLEVGVPVVPEMVFRAGEFPAPREVVRSLGEKLVLKPADKGSSCGLVVLEGADALEAAFASVDQGTWMLERRVLGREFSVGVLDGQAMGVVEIVPEGGVYDYRHKYTQGTTKYLFPAALDDPLYRRIQGLAEAAFRTLGCRDFARVDFMLDEAVHCPYFLEVNTLPGLTINSLLPRSASCFGYTYSQLIHRMIEPALARYKNRPSP